MTKVGFVTCVQLGLSCMETIYRVGGRLELAVSLHDHLARIKSGRVYLDEFCLRHNLDLLKIRNVNEPSVIGAIREKRLDWLMIIGWSQIARAELLGAPRMGVIGIHPTLLPEGRGRAAIPWAILKGLNRTGVTMFRLDEGVDTGDIISQEVLPIAPDETATTLYGRVLDAHERLIEKVWPSLMAGNVQLTPQLDADATEWPGRSAEDGQFTFESDCLSVDKLVRATTHPYPGAFFHHRGKCWRIWYGVAQTGGPAPRDLVLEGKTLRIPLADGVFIATDWSEENMPAVPELTAEQAAAH